jgi:hypothetical protein
MITVIDGHLDARYEFEADDWDTDERGQLVITKGQARVATFAPGWRGVFATRQEIQPEQGDKP